ncbi:uncharacterized protein MELLADRAFT_109525 [Melampsora larici-populina 98AG31]|uniref:ATPase inhibitor, mitochondrial n=1 Tax=Melampsora larici-populina (strain 98AG31 / pathotype 3-4-7) TaxID=747676 RepID=F4RWR8_MELLP|nr:uncharacterized protein MELLADRAFT_109525 [Melampsora larici-populina 98AG31]EGG03076.1 hypothetical protein MELLADRAFT_109525 [Melampsora larici-populina 98AG31]
MLSISTRRLLPIHSSITKTTLPFSIIRTYSDHPGATANSKDFAQKERSEETRYMRQKEAEDLKKLKSELDQHKKKLSELEENMLSLFFLGGRFTKIYSSN